MNLRQSKKLLFLVSAILAWTLLGGFAETEKEEIRLDPISAADRCFESNGKIHTGGYQPHYGSD